VRGRRGAVGTAPTIFVAEERGLLLGAGQGDAEVFVGSLAQHASVGECGADRLLDCGVVQRLDGDFFHTRWFLTLGQQLHSADAIAADGGEQVEGLAGVGPKAALETSTDGFAVGQEVVEIALYDSPFVRSVAWLEIE
jgi:hypothetical protein